MIDGTYTGEIPPPAWWNEIQLMEAFGWTEKQLREENTLEMLERIRFVLSEKGRKQSIEDKRQQAEIERSKHARR